jgi:hypothetical protein
MILLLKQLSYIIESPHPTRFLTPLKTMNATFNYRYNDMNIVRLETHPTTRAFNLHVMSQLLSATHMPIAIMVQS